MKRIFTTILLTGAVWVCLKAQIVAPDFLCVKSDTLFWDLPTNNCGPFVGYEVYSSDNASGPFTLLTTVNNQNQIFFHDPNPSGELRYYYLQSNFDCPGLMALQSDTLDSRPPETTSLKSVTVSGTDVLLCWEENLSPEVFGYIIYRSDPMGVIPIDTVLASSTTYLDTNAEPDMESEIYYVNALDECGNTSIFDLEHHTIYLEADATRCSVDLTWNLYSNWDGGIVDQGIWVSIDGAPPVLHMVLNGNETSFSFRNVNDGEAYCFYIEAKGNDATKISRSNEACTLPTAFAQPINELYLINLSVEPDNTVNVSWGVNDNAYIKELEVIRTTNPSNFVTAFMDSPEARFPAENQTLDPNVNAASSAQSYLFTVIDSCGNEVTTSQGTTIHLQGQPSSINSSQLEWTPLLIENATVHEYEIIRVTNGSEISVGSVSGSVFSFEDIFGLADVGDGTICYYVVAKGAVVSPSGSSIDIASRSNIVCLRQSITIHAPNAFAPNGFNQEFKPVILSGNIAKYEMLVFDRYGSIVYSADSPEEGWKGKKDGKKLPQGVYVYRIVVQLENGDRAEKKGNVLLLR